MSFIRELEYAEREIERLEAEVKKLRIASAGRTLEIERLRVENGQLVAELNKYELAALQARIAQVKRDD